MVFVAWTAYAIALFGFRILDPLPLARRAVIEQMQAGVVVFDNAWRVASLNPAAEKILGIAKRRCPRQDLGASDASGRAGAFPGGSTHPAGGATELPKMIFGDRRRARHYAPVLSELRDFRGLLMGHMLMLHDVTEEQRARAQALEQQRSLATLRERERLARELHDSIGQVFGFANLKVGAARKLLADGKLAKAEDHATA